MSARNKKNENGPKQPARRRQRTQLSALTADPFRLYEASVQNTEASIALIDQIWAGNNTKFPMSLREDFCGSAKLCCDWVASHPKRRAIGVDIDSSTIDWAKKNNVALLGESSKRVNLLKKDVLTAKQDCFDVVAAFNFSYWVFHHRETLKKYFALAKESLNPGGFFIIDMYGGPDSQYILAEETDHDEFVYVWEQESFDPINNHTVCHIHYRFSDQTELKKAFSYDWRMWSMPELRDILREAGFSRIDSWWDGKDDIVIPCICAQSMISWIAYLVAWR